MSKSNKNKNKSGEQTPEEKLAAEQKAAQQNASNEKSPEEKEAEEKLAAEQKAADQKAAEEKEAEEKLAVEEKAAEQKAAEEKAAKKKAASEKVNGSNWKDRIEELKYLNPDVEKFYVTEQDGSAFIRNSDALNHIKDSKFENKKITEVE